MNFETVLLVLKTPISLGADRAVKIESPRRNDWRLFLRPVEILICSW